MPTYDYVCKDCGYEFEEFQSMSAPKLTECPKCKGRVERLIGTGAGMIFKGSGFYETDYRSDSYQKAAKADKAPTPTKSDKPAKPEKKAPAKKAD